MATCQMRPTKPRLHYSGHVYRACRRSGPSQRLWRCTGKTRSSPGETRRDGSTPTEKKRCPSHVFSLLHRRTSLIPPSPPPCDQLYLPPSPAPACHIRVSTHDMYTVLVDHAQKRLRQKGQEVYQVQPRRRRLMTSSSNSTVPRGKLGAHAILGMSIASFPSLPTSQALRPFLPHVQCHQRWIACRKQARVPGVHAPSHRCNFIHRGDEDWHRDLPRPQEGYQRQIWHRR